MCGLVGLGKVIDIAGKGGVGGGFPAIWDSGFCWIVRFRGGVSLALGGAMAKPRDDRQKDLLKAALEAARSSTDEEGPLPPL
jgi:hypothetical protein